MPGLLRHLARLLAAAVILAALRAPARADDLADAQAHWRDLDYDLVIASADRALAGARDDATRVEALRLKASALVVLDRADDAEAVFGRLFSIAPDYDLPEETSPRVLGVFLPARARWQVEQEKRLATELGPALAALTLSVDLPPNPRGGRAFPVKVTLADPGAIADSIAVHYRRAPSKHYSTLTTPARAGATTITIPESFTASPSTYTLELYVRVRHRSGVTLRSDGDPDKPRAIAVGAGSIPRATPISKRWWFWPTIVVGVLAGAAALTAVLPAGPQDIRVTQ